MEVNDLETELKKISIRGRVAYGLKCIYNYIEEDNVTLFKPEIENILAQIKEFLVLDKFNVWEKKIREYTPSSILDTHPDNDFRDYEYVNVEELRRIENAYRNLPNSLISIIENTIAIETNNLYGGVIGYSSVTLDPLMEIISIMLEKNIKLPNINLFKQYSFLQDNGWGEKIENFNEIIR
ncbi:hypothetical protein [Aequorivita antarctica]|uniref:Uncharacterized protein n=1 Tax=Aequorivita antarctica TaxID=153266 RepID=A0A5C6YVF5_9FLAO|nr:hypothetical protein [Aequorivita antarctica]TXD71576.1 hypothetical protein ESU54_16265 [Aequorivita antarctica]SRX75280.1 hypothetical protein AEQU3_02274 [Aequorivita antarctica]